MNGKYQVGSGRVVTVTHDSPFIYENDTSSSEEVKGKHSFGQKYEVPSQVALPNRIEIEASETSSIDNDTRSSEEINTEEGGISYVHSTFET